jgi:hypothetical protein
VHTIKKKKKVNCTGKYCVENCLLKHVIAGKIDGMTEVQGRRGKRHKQLLDKP